MSFKVVNAFAIPEMNIGENVSEPLGATLVSECWVTEDDQSAGHKAAGNVVSFYMNALKKYEDERVKKK